MEKEEYDKKIKRCEQLGATTFQKIVFGVEHIKYKFIKKFLPHYIDWCDKACNRKCKKALKKATTEEERRQLIDFYRRQKMLIRKEYHSEKNRNYHLDMDRPTELLPYLYWNKEVHQKGMIRNAVFIAGATASLVLGVAPIVASIVLAAELGGLFINFQCVNIQNCNIYRYKKREPVLKKMAERHDARNVQKYSEAATAVNRVMESTTELPSWRQVVEGTKTPEELRQLRELITRELGTRQKNVPIQKTKLGGK